MYPAATQGHLLVHLCVRHTLQQWWENVQFHRLQHDLTDTALTHFEKRIYFKVPHVYSWSSVYMKLCFIVVSILRCGGRRLPKVSRLLGENESMHKRLLQCSEEVGKSVHFRLTWCLMVRVHTLQPSWWECWPVGESTLTAVWQGELEKREQLCTGIAVSSESVSWHGGIIVSSLWEKQSVLSQNRH